MRIGETVPDGMLHGDVGCAAQQEPEKKGVEAVVEGMRREQLTSGDQRDISWPRIVLCTVWYARRRIHPTFFFSTINT